LFVIEAVVCFHDLEFELL